MTRKVSDVSLSMSDAEDLFFSHLISSHPAHGGRRLARDLYVKTKFVPGHHGDDVLAASAAGVQVDFGRIFQGEEKSHDNLYRP